MYCSTPGLPVHCQRPLSRWCHPTISSSVVPFSSCLQSFPASGSFQMNQLFTSGGQNIRVSASASVLPKTIKNWFPWGRTCWTRKICKYTILYLCNISQLQGYFKISWNLNFLTARHSSDRYKYILLSVDEKHKRSNVRWWFKVEGMIIVKNIKQNRKVCLLILYHLNEIRI